MYEKNTHIINYDNRLSLSKLTFTLQRCIHRDEYKYLQ